MAAPVGTQPEDGQTPGQTPGQRTVKRPVPHVVEDLVCHPVADASRERLGQRMWAARRAKRRRHSQTRPAGLLRPARRLQQPAWRRLRTAWWLRSPSITNKNKLAAERHVPAAGHLVQEHGLELGAAPLAQPRLEGREVGHLEQGVKAQLGHGVAGGGGALHEPAAPKPGGRAGQGARSCVRGGGRFARRVLRRVASRFSG
jgi:hypothetical protein